jgi:uncharacterized protein (DUF885 family)
MNSDERSNRNMIDDRELAQKELDYLYSSDTIGRAELIYEIYRLLNSGKIGFKTCCEKLQNINPCERTEKFLDLVYGLYLYLHPDIATRSRCLKSEGEFGIQASRLIENRFTNRFSASYLDDSSTFIRYVALILKPIFGDEEDKDDEEDNNEEDKNETAVEDKNETEENSESVTAVEDKIEPDMNLKIVHWIIQTEKQRLDQSLEYYANPLDTFEGPVVSMFETLEKHKIESYSDAFNFIHRLKSVMLEIHHLTQFMEKQRSLKGVEIPKIVARQCYETIQGFLKIEPHDHTFMVNFKSDIELLKMPDDLYQIAVEFVSDSVSRALYHLGDWIQEFFLEEDEVPIERDDDEENEAMSEYSICCDRNRGAEYYAYCLKHHTTTDMTPEEIHELGLNEVSRISADILRYVREHLQQSGEEEVVETFEQSIEYIRRLTSRESSIYPDTPEGESEIISDIQAIDQQIKTLLPSLFVEGTLPEAECEYRFTPAHQKDMMPAGYYFEPSFDGKSKGAFYMNLRSELLRFGLPTLVAHEAIPGHHFQLSLVSESDLHPIRKIEFYNPFNAYLEGWALYTERLGREFDLYDTPLSMVGHLMDEMLRGARLVIDTGIHHYGWERQKALDYICSVCPFPLKNNEIEIDRYIGWPGQACSYKVGQIKIVEARVKRIDGGDTLQEFNTRLIANGAVPIDMINF